MLFFARSSFCKHNFPVPEERKMLGFDSLGFIEN
jgi:hypothetical protein